MDDQTETMADENLEYGSGAIELETREITLYIWNTVANRDDRFDMDITILPHMTEEQILLAAKMKAREFVSGRSCYSGQKLRLKGEAK